MDASNRKYKRKHPDSNPQDHFGAGNPLGLDGAGSVQNGVGVHPRTKRRRTLGKHFCQQDYDLEESTAQKALHEAVGVVSTGTESQAHRTEKQCRKKKSVSRMQVEIETLINSEVPSALSQDENGSFEGQNGAQGAQNARRRKSRKKKKKGLKDQKSGVGREAALEYLHLWEDERSSWCFKKKAQFWLLQNMYEEDQVPKLEFKILLKYLEGLQGNQRQLAMERAQEVLEGYEGDGEKASKVPKKQYRRAVAILRTLA